MQELYFWHLVYSIKIRLSVLNSNLKVEVKGNFSAFAMGRAFINVIGDDMSSSLQKFGKKPIDKMMDLLKYHKILYSASEAVNKGMGPSVVVS